MGRGPGSTPDFAPVNDLARVRPRASATPRPSAIRRPCRRDAIDPRQVAAALRRLPSSPLTIPWRGWKRILRRTMREMISDRVPLVAAGCAFYATLAPPPAVSILVSIDGLVFDLMTVEPHPQVLRDLTPASTSHPISHRVHERVSKP
jgi:membrane protein